MAELKASPQEPITGALAKALEFMAHPTVDGQEIKPRGFNFANLLPLESGAEFFKNRSYGKPLTTGAGGLGGTQNLAPDVRDFALDVAPYAPDLANVAGKGAKAVGKMAGEELNKRFLSGQMFPYGAPTANFVIKPKGGNWLNNSVEQNLKRLKTNPTAQQSLEEMRQVYPPDQMIRLSPETRETVERAFPHLENQVALNNWIDKNLTNYVKNQMGTPEDPIRLMIDNRINEINSKYSKDIAKADRLTERAQSEPDPRRQANFQREANRLRTEAENEKELSTKHVAHVPLEDVNELLDQMRVDEGFPLKGMGKSTQAKSWEDISDMSINPKKAKSIQEAPERLAQLEQAKQESLKAHDDLNQKLIQHIRDKGLNLSPEQENNFVRNIANDDKEQIVGDDTFSKALAKQLNLHSHDLEYNKELLEENPFVNKLDPNTRVYSAQTGGLGFDHVLDVLKENLTTGRLKPEELKNISIEQAVRKTADYDLALAKKMQEAQAKKLDEMTLHKEYPNGMKWVQLDQPGQFAAESQAMGHSVRGYEPPQGHPDWIPESGEEGSPYYGHGGWEAIKSGKAKVYSLVDPKGNPHTTIEVAQSNPTEEHLHKQPREVQDEFNRRFENWIYNIDYRPSPEEKLSHAQYLFDDLNIPQNLDITQIKGKQNRAPNEQYLPFVQDFVKSGNWSDVGDLHNTGLHDTVMTGAQDIGKASGFDLPRFMPTEDYETVMPLIHKYNNLKQIHGENAPIDEELKSYLPKDTQAPVDLGTVSGTPDATPQFKRGGKVHISDNPDAMMMELSDRKFAGGGAIAKMLERAAPKTISEIRAIAERMAPQVTGEVSGVAGKSNKQFMREKSLPVDIRVDTPMPDPEMVDLAKHKGKVMIGIKGDPTVTNQTLHKVGDIELESPSPQHGGPLYGQGKDVFWASGLGPAQGVQNLAKEASQAYNAPVLGNYVMMGPNSYYYAQHLADANLNAIAKSGMTPEQIEKLNELIRKGGPLSKGPRPNFETVEDIGNAYMQMQMDPKLRKHFNQLMMKPTLSEEIGIPRGQDIAHAITEPSLRNLEIGVTGKSIGEMRPDQPLDYSSHPTYSHDIPGSFLGTSPYPVPYELSFPDTVKAVRANPKQSPQEFGSFGMVGPRQPIDQQLIDEIGEYQKQMKALTGKKKGGKVKVTKNSDAMQMELQNKAFKRK